MTLRKLYKFDPLLESLLVLALIVVATQRSLRNVPELFPGGALLGDVLASLALSYVSAWVFNLLVIRLPKRRDKISVVIASGNLVARYASTAVGILQMMAGRTGHPSPPRQPDRDYLLALFADIRPGAEAPMQSIDGYRYNWLQYSADSIDRAANIKTRLTPLFPYLDAETVSAIAAVENSTIYQVLPTQAQMSVSNPSMVEFVELFMGLWQACALVGDRYLAEVAPLLDPASRLNIDQPNGPAAA